MSPDRFGADVEAKPAALRALGDAIECGDAFGWPHIPRGGRVLLAGMGSSNFVAQVAARRLRGGGVVAAAELATSEQLWPVSEQLTVVAISAGGRSVETLDLAKRLAGTPRLIALTNAATTPLGELATDRVDVLAGEESSGIACRSALHTLIALLALEEQLTGRVLDLAGACRLTAQAIEVLLETRARWLPEVADRLAGPHGTWLLAPTERISSALQGALMIREVVRRQADACETGDWAHVDVYLTKTLDYRALVFAGSRYDDQAARWMIERAATAVSVQPDAAAALPGAAASVSYPAGHPLVPLLVETTVVELVADHWFREAATTVS